MLYCDNKATIFFSHNNKSSGSAKHIDLKYLAVGEKVHNLTINLEHISTKERLADQLTKGLHFNIFKNMLLASVYWKAFDPGRAI
jgi:hypothetical protein